MKIRFILVFLFFFGCGPQYKVVHTYVPPSTTHGKACIEKCVLSKMNCKQRSLDDYDRCIDREEKFALKEYEKYVQDALARNVQPDKSITSKSFMHKSNCVIHKNNSCDEDYRQCYLDCGGRIDIDTVCVANCDKA